MNYFSARSDLNFIQEFQAQVLKLWGIENDARKKIDNSNSWLAGTSTPAEIQVRIQRIATNDSSDYQVVRDKVARGVTRAQNLAARHGVPSVFKSFPPAFVGGPVISQGIFEAILLDSTHGGVERQLISDAINRITGMCEQAVEKELYQLINPIYWVKNSVLLILRVPFMLIEATGFSVHTFEEHFFGKSLKLLMLLGLVYGLLMMGFGKEDLVKIIESVVGSK